MQEVPKPRKTLQNAHQNAHLIFLPKPAETNPCRGACDGRGPIRLAGPATCRSVPAATVSAGVPNTILALRDNSTLRLTDPRNLIVATLDGIGPQNFSHRMSFQQCRGSPASSPTSRAQRVNYLRATLAARSPMSPPPTCGPAQAQRRALYVTSSVQTLKLVSVLGPNVWAMGTSAASRPWPIRMRPMRGVLLRASKVYQRPPR